MTILNATTVNIDLENGFIYATDDNESNNYFQACLTERKDGNGYKKEIDSSDCGWNDGICGDYNESIKSATEENFEEFLKLARKSGVKVK